MKNLLIAFCLVFVLSVVCSAQRSDKDAKHDRSTAAVIVGSAAKGTWAVTSFTTRKVIAPAGKAVVVKAAPAAGKFVLRNSAKHMLPLMVKLSVL